MSSLDLLQAKWFLLIAVLVAACVYVVAGLASLRDTSPRCKVCGERYGKYPSENIKHEWWPMVAGTSAEKRYGFHRYEPTKGAK